MSFVAVVAVAVYAFVALTAVVMIFSAAHSPLDTEAPERWLVRHAPFRLRRILRSADERVVGGVVTVVAFAVLFASAAVVGWVFDTIDDHRGVARYDEAAAEWGARNATDASTRILDAITQLGGTGWLLIAMGAIGLVAAVRHRELRTLAYLAIVGLGVSLVNNGLKWLVDRDRPDIAQLTGHGGSSFPSGHSAAAAACWAAILLIATRRRPRTIRTIGAVTAGVIAIAVAVSRVLLGVHWVSDVVAGLIVGWAWFLIVTIVFGGRLLRFGEPLERVAGGGPTTPSDPDAADRHVDARIADDDADAAARRRGSGRTSIDHETSVDDRPARDTNDTNDTNDMNDMEEQRA